MVNRTWQRHPLVAWMAAALVVTAIGVGACGDGEPNAEIRTATPEEQTPPGDNGGATADAGMTPDREPTEAAASIACEEREPLREQLAGDVEDAMEGYNGEWGFAFYDLHCDAMVSVNPDYQQYTASASKIVSVVAALQAVEEGRIELEEIEPLLELIMEHSLDFETDELETYVTAQDLDHVMEAAGTSDASYVDGAWRYTFMTAPDMARVWAAVVRGELLGEELTEYLMDLAGTPDIPEGFETFPGGEFSWPGFQWGQKAGYYIADGIPYFLIGAGFLVQENGPEQFIPVVIIRTMNPEFLDPQRRLVWPLVVEHIAAVTGARMPAEVGLGP